MNIKSIVSVLLFLGFASFQASASCQDDLNAIAAQVSAYSSITLANGHVLGIGTIQTSGAKSVTTPNGVQCQASFTGFQYGDQGTLYWHENSWGCTISTWPVATAKCQNQKNGLI